MRATADTARVEAGPALNYARTSDGLTLAYQVLGRGPVLVWLPSLSNLLAQWRVPVLRAAYLELARSMTLVLYDGRGTGSSDRRVDTADLGLDAHLRDLDAVLSAAGSRRPRCSGTTTRRRRRSHSLRISRRGSAGWCCSVARPGCATR